MNKLMKQWRFGQSYILIQSIKIMADYDLPVHSQTSFGIWYSSLFFVTFLLRDFVQWQCDFHSCPFVLLAGNEDSPFAACDDPLAYE